MSNALEKFAKCQADQSLLINRFSILIIITHQNGISGGFMALILLLLLPGILQAQDAKAILSNAAKAMGADNLRTIQYTGSGSNAGIGQNKNPNAAWPVVRVKTYTR